ncbi:calcium-binding protein [Psychromarinibacter sp. S121]|uniref:calcium-binding protein n=1 Tax=Psychromarinibacter sp. S121 TaxID=3415127 RepID=UPI003C79DD1C
MAIFNINNLRTTAINPISDDSIVVSQNGTLSIEGIAIAFGTAEDVRLLNAGTIFGGIEGDGPGLTITNTGTMSTSDDEVIDIGVQGGPVNFTLHNSGNVYSMGYADNAILLQSGGNVFINSGEIVGHQQSAILIFSEVDGFNGAAGTRENLIVNTGLISSGFGANSSGTLIERPAINLFADADTVINQGTILGGVKLGSADDIFDGRGGTVVGEVSGGFGDDLFIIDDASIELAEFEGEGSDTVQAYVSYALEDNFEILELGGAGDIDGTGNGQQNTLLGNAGNNRLAGGGSSDVIDGGAGDDDIDGGRGNDVLFGGDGNDTIAGRAGNEVIDGGDGDDWIFGGLGVDAITSGDGNDTLIGGEGSDELTGGGGQDVFVFARLSDSPNGAGDIVTDFEVGTDLIDLSSFSNGILNIAIGGSFTAAGPSARTFENSFGNTVLRIDVDGNGSTDMRVDIVGAQGLTEADFIL